MGLEAILQLSFFPHSKVNMIISYFTDENGSDSKENEKERIAKVCLPSNENYRVESRKYDVGAFWRYVKASKIKLALGKAKIYSVNFFRKIPVLRVVIRTVFRLSVFHFWTSIFRLLENF